MPYGTERRRRAGVTYSGVWGCEGGYECCHDEPREAELVCPREGMLQVGRRKEGRVGQW